jgi:hypothetical protein
VCSSRQQHQHRHSLFLSNHWPVAASVTSCPVVSCWRCLAYSVAALGAHQHRLGAWTSRGHLVSSDLKTDVITCKEVRRVLSHALQSQHLSLPRLS